MSIHQEKSGLWIVTLPNGKQFTGFSKSSVIETAEQHLAEIKR